MKQPIHLITSICIAALMLTLSGCKQGKNAINSDDKKISYGIGLDLGRKAKQDGFTVDPDALANGVRDGLSDTKKQAFEDKDIEAAMMAKQKELMAQREEKAKTAGASNGKAGEDYLAANAKKDGVKVTASGLQYKVIKAGPAGGKKPLATSEVTVNYRGTLLDGTEFDSSYKRNEPATFPLNRVIPGWTEGVQLMTEGSTYEFVIPAALAYGAQGAGPIAPNSTLIFQVELIKVK
ncbi:FKBP-type peptidyl-prolyl cis-trans isomerase FkpA/FKBP-type peptidyl-prolyl cis-trans isomerase FklB [Verrucomicrobium sp. GAS474]|uniref:FKBP-type peptidyl-prolyl cis-trans isomerase n=1 Tax=Verrucomicrobium sp. GAS474 TaxID=1882831 RepID=UPI000879DAD1|nr:FKBP-type peptidyl-prolyl cis-trans isomerase [Verrucomicrobium sp. GAS474]SDU10002.1 FKBP-type peptidyl-prolyl cis-trans isomerase FkpA/FKBP-type peptidyl-prolyl cis-trans isomerase FklB [Verrucomicrobium sp. GAS474]